MEREEFSERVDQLEEALRRRAKEEDKRENDAIVYDVKVKITMMTMMRRRSTRRRVSSQMSIRMMMVMMIRRRAKEDDKKKSVPIIHDVKVMTILMTVLKDKRLMQLTIH